MARDTKDTRITSKFNHANQAENRTNDYRYNSVLTKQAANAASTIQQSSVAAQNAVPYENPVFQTQTVFSADQNDFEVYDSFKDFADEYNPVNPVQPENKKDSFGRRVRVHQTVSTMSHKQMAKYMSEYEALSNNGETTHSEFIHFDETDRKGNFIHDRSVYGHDKLAQSRISDSAGGGANTTFSFDKKGNLEAKVKLNSYFKREDRKGFIHRSADFIDSSRKIVDDFAPDNNEAAASNIDSKAEVFLTHSIQRHKDKASRYKQISKVSKKEEKKLSKEIREERKASAKETLKEQSVNNRQAIENSHTALFIRENHYELSSPFIDRPSISNTSSPFIEKHTDSIPERAKKAEIITVLTEKGVIGNKKEDTSIVPASRNDVPKEINASNKEPLFLEDKSARKSRDEVSDRHMTKNEKHSQLKTKRKATDKRKNKEVRKAASLAAFSKAIESKRVLQNELADFSGNSSGDIIKDGGSGLLSVATVGIKNAAKNFVILAAKSLGSVAKSALIKAAPFLLLLILICGGFFVITSSATSVIAALGGESGDAGVDLDVVGDGTMYAHAPLPQSTIDNLIDQLWERYPPSTEGDTEDPNAMNNQRETILRYALSKVGCAYDQDYHTSLTAEIFDCSSLAYRAYREIGVDVSNNGVYSACEEYRHMENTGKNFSGGSLLPGDLIFYKNNPDRYLDIGHVAIYLGRVEMDGTVVDKSVEALGTSWGVVLSDTRATDVYLARPLKP